MLKGFIEQNRCGIWDEAEFWRERDRRLQKNIKISVRWLNLETVCFAFFFYTTQKAKLVNAKIFVWVKGCVLLKLKLLRGCKQTKKIVGYIFCLRFFCDPLKLACVRQPSSTKPSFPTVHTTEAFGIYKVLDNRNSHHANGMVRVPLDAFTFKKWSHCSSEAGSSTFKKLRAEPASGQILKPPRRSLAWW